jgi:hypothetical protein
MANFSYTEKRNLEEFLHMAGGYVLDFSNRTFQEFVYDSIRLNIDDETVGGLGSKAVRLRHFWKHQPDHIVGKLLKDFVDYRDLDSPLREKCRKIAERLLLSAPIHDAEIIAVLSRREEFERLANSVRESIEKNDPEAGLDRLHTFAIKFTRSLCQKHGITTERDKPLHSIFGEYVKKLKKSDLIESPMTERILKSTISTLDAFNQVRNERSLAHDNPVLNRNESLLIFNHVTSAIRFVWTLEQSISRPTDGDIPF